LPAGALRELTETRMRVLAQHVLVLLEALHQRLVHHVVAARVQGARPCLVHLVANLCLFALGAQPAASIV
jgi:hypothetical protein